MPYDLRMQGYDSLYVAGSGVFRTRDPTRTMVALALRLTEGLRQDLRVRTSL